MDTEKLNKGIKLSHEIDKLIEISKRLNDLIKIVKGSGMGIRILSHEGGNHNSSMGCTIPAEYTNNVLGLLRLVMADMNGDVDDKKQEFGAL